MIGRLVEDFLMASPQARERILTLAREASEAKDA